jgi:ABC-2 type transport system permease protein
MSKIGLVIRREYNERVRKRSFLVSTLLMPLLMIGLMVGMGLMMNRQSSEYKVIEVIDHSGVIAPKLENTPVMEFRPTDRTLEQTTASHEGTWGLLVIGEDVMTDPGNVQLYTWSSSTIETEQAISGAIADIIEAEKLKTYDIENLSQILADVRTSVSVKASQVDAERGDQKESSSVLAMALAYIFGFVMYMFVLLYGAQVMQGVIEEKNSKVLEVVVSSVKPFELMRGKIIGIACVAVTQFAIWVVLIAVGGGLAMNAFIPADLMAAARGMSAGMGPDMAGALNTGVNPEAVAALGNLLDTGYIVRMLAGFLFYFVGGYLLYAAMFAAVGSAVDNVQDSQQFQMPITLPILFGMMGMISAMRDPGGALAFWLSVIPFTSPIVMVARLPYGVPAWELALSIALLAATFVAMVWLAVKIYRVGIFMYGKKPSFRELAKWITYK